MRKTPLWLAAGAVLTLSGCLWSSKPSKAPDAPASQSNLASLNESLTTSASKVAAAVTVASENAEKPSIVRSEASVALAHLPTPSDGDLAIARQRVAAKDPKVYEAAITAAKAALAATQSQLAKVEKDRKEVQDQLAALRRRNAELEKDLTTARADGRRDVWTIVGAVLAIAAAFATYFAGWRVAAGIAAAAALCGAIPTIIESKWFAVIAGVTIAVSASLFLWVAWDKARDTVHESDKTNPSDNG